MNGNQTCTATARRCGSRGEHECAQGWALRAVCRRAVSYNIVLKQVRDRFAVVRAANGLCQHRRNVDRLDLGAQGLPEERQRHDGPGGAGEGIASARAAATSGATPSSESARTCLSKCGIVFDATMLSRRDLLIFSSAAPEKMPCVTMAMTLLAPFSNSTSAAMPRVPQVSAMSSTRMAFVRDDGTDDDEARERAKTTPAGQRKGAANDHESYGRPPVRCVQVKASPPPRSPPRRGPGRTRLALDVANQDHARDLVGLLALLVNERKIDVELVGNRRRAARGPLAHQASLCPSSPMVSSLARATLACPCARPHRLAPPASGDTITTSLTDGKLTLMYLSMLGSAYRLSTGMSKKPCTRAPPTHAPPPLSGGATGD